jgi:hypothetical protein
MKPKIILMLAALLMPVHASDPVQNVNAQFTKEIEAALIEIQMIKLGQTRKELLKVFTTEGGLSGRTWNHYVYRKCLYIKVDIRFEKVDSAKNGLAIPDDIYPYPDDKIISISKPYLEFSIID